MSKENVQKFYDFLRENPTALEELQKKVKDFESVEKAKAAVIEFAAAKGFEYTAEDVAAFEADAQKELSFEELDEVNAAGVTICAGLGFGDGKEGDYGVGVSCCKWVGAGIGVTWQEITKRKK